MSFFTSEYPNFKEKYISGRYITHEHITPLLNQLKGVFEVTEVGKSVEGSPIECVHFGKGKHKILMWSQMHGNESTTTKAVFDFLKFMDSGNQLASKILESCSIRIIPMLNPDGALAYTRSNTNEIDLNRDAQKLSQPESKVLRNVYNRFQPDFCFNLHDQRTMYNVGDSAQPATVSFLAPAMDAQRSIPTTRGKSMRLIVAMNRRLQQLIPNQIGRYDDGFNSNCVGDTFQMLGTPTVLFEAGHFPNDYERERTRECIFIALTSALEVIADDSLMDYGEAEYFEIPENGKRFFDVLIQNANHLNAAYDPGVSLGIRFDESLVKDTIQFESKLDSVFGSDYFLGHQTFDCADPESFRKLQKDLHLMRLLGS
ncbi:peptidase M14 [Aggregatimonas sangjinii]|uniref:Peptidase M14 n=1 Tax=Aggregatimonas sangjinii TaxID=2583587 RepID=A0A5B7SMA1_9FLAO|nr:M14 metallopeptidase family protein [Aggregatimonas sangjinii]QCW99794.1 peptidase M14 [Aggregatimonas sangjinii]